MTRLAFAVCLTGCIYQPPDDGGEIEIPVAVLGGLPELEDNVVAIGDSIEGVTFVLAETTVPGAVTIVPAGRLEVLGVRYCAIVPDRQAFCERRILMDTSLACCLRPAVLLHELGHVFGLEHERERDNIMGSDPSHPGTEITDEQRRRVRTAALAYSVCLGDG